MQTRLILDDLQSQDEGIWTRLGATATEMSPVQQANHNSWNTWAQNPNITGINYGATETYSQGTPTLNAFCYPPENRSAAENVPDIFPGNSFGSQQTVFPTECNDVEMVDIMDQLEPYLFSLHGPMGSTSMQMDNDIHSVATNGGNITYEEDNNPYAHLILRSMRDKRESGHPTKAPLQRNCCNSSTPSSLGGRGGVRAPAARCILLNGSRYRSLSGSQASSTDDITQLASCLAVLFGSDGSSLIHDFAHLRLEAARGKQKSPRKKARRSSKGSNKNTKTSPQRPTNGVSKKGKDGKKLAVGKKKEFICQYDSCGKAFERRYNLKVHTRRHTGEMPYTCPKTDEGCFLYFRWRSSLRHHLKTVHKNVVPIAQNTARGCSTPVPVVPIASILQNKNSSPSSSEAADSSASRGSSSSRLRVSNRIRKKLSRVRKNYPAVAVRDPTTEELARLQIAAELKARGEKHVAASEALKTGLVRNAQDGSLRPTMDVNPQPSVGNASPPSADTPDYSSLLISDEELSNKASGTRGLEAEDDDIFHGMDIDGSPDLALPMLEDLPHPEEFFREN